MTEPPSAKDRLRGAAAKAAPAGSTARAVLRMARQMALDGMGYVPRARALWRLASDPTPEEPDYADWLSRHGARLHSTALPACGERVPKAGGGQ